MKIDRQNYESYFLDYIEGKLNAEETARLTDFLDHNPDLKAELDNFESISLIPELNIFTEKDLLKKNIESQSSFFESNFVEFCIARMEGDMDISTESLFESYLQKHPEKLIEYRQYLKTILEPDKKIIYKEKRKLKHFEVSYKRITIYRVMAAAASIAILVFAYKYNFGFHKIGDTKISHTVQTETKSVTVNNDVNTEAVKTQRTQGNKVVAYQSIRVINTSLKQTQELVIKQDIQIPLQNRIELNQLKTPALQDKPLISAYRETTGVEEKISAGTPKEQKYLTLDKLAENEIKKVIKKENLPIEKEISLWTLAKSGVIGINKIFGSKIVLNDTKDTTTHRTRFELNTGLLGFYNSSEKN